MNRRYPGISMPAGHAWTHRGCSGTSSRGPTARSVLVISKILTPLGQASSQRPQAAQNQGIRDAAISSIKSSSTCRINRRILNSLIPVIGYPSTPFAVHISVIIIAFDLQTAVQVKHPRQFCGRTGIALCGISNTSVGHIMTHSSQESHRSGST